VVIVLRFLGLVGALVLVAACGARSGPPGGRDAWVRARGVAEAYLRSRYGEPPAWAIEKELAGVPFLFRVNSPQELFVLVHGDRVVEQRGLTALDRYLRESRAARGIEAADLVTLVEHLEALPPEPDRAKQFLRQRTAAPPLRPRLDRAGDRTQLVLYYGPRDREGDGDDARDVTEWTLTIAPHDAAVWTKRSRPYDSEHHRFVDVDHAN
jgi:hypothetical protein